MDVEIFESGKKELRIEKYPDTCGRGLSDTITAACNNSRIIVEWLNHVFRIRIVICSIFGSWKGPREHCVIVLTRPAKPELLSGKFSCLSCDFRSLLRQSHFSFRNSSGVVLPVTIHLNVETQDVEAFCDFYFLRCCVWLVFSFLRVFFDE